MDANPFTKSLVLVLCEVLYSIAGTVDYDLNSNHITIRCKPNEVFAVLPKLNASVTPSTVAVYDCELPDIPEHTYISEFQRLNISIENLKMLYLQGNETTLYHALGEPRLRINKYFRGFSAISGNFIESLEGRITYFNYTLSKEDYQGGEITVDTRVHTIFMECINGGSLPILDHIQTPTKVDLYFCVPNDSFSDILNRVNINLSKLKIFNIPSIERLSSSYLIGLPNGTYFEVRLQCTAAGIIYAGNLNEENSVLHIELSGKGEYAMRTLTSKLFNLTYKHLIVYGMGSEENFHIADLVGPFTNNMGEINKVTLKGNMKKVKCFPEKLFTKISLKSLEVIPARIPNRRTPVESNVFNSKTLTIVLLKGVEMPVLPISNNLESITLDSSMSEGKWGGCRNLKRLVLIDHRFRPSFMPQFLEANEGWLTHCEQMTELKMYNMDFSYYWAGDNELIDKLSIIISGLKSLKQLVIVKSSLKKLTENFFASLSNIEYIDLSDNELQYSNLFYERFNLPGVIGCTDYTHVAIVRSSEHEERFFYRKHYHSINTQEICDFDCNILNVDARYGGATHDSFIWSECPDIKDHLEGLQETMYLLVEENLGKLKHSIKNISLQGQGLRSLIYDDFTNLTYLDLSENHLSGNFKVNHLPSNTKLPVLVDLRETEVHSSSRARCNNWINSHHHRRLLQAKKITVLMSWSVPCDCSIGCLALQMSSLPTLKITGIKCKENSQPLDRRMLATIDTFRCTKYSCGKCTCRRRWRDNVTVAWCGALGLRALPAALRYERNLGEIHAPGNAISRLQADDLPSTLLVLDLRNNSMISAEAAAATMLFSNKSSKILLAGSTVDCGCDEENLPWLTALRENNKQVEDYETVSCSEYTKGLLKNLNINELCAESWTGWPLVAFLAVISACVIAAVLIVKQYQKQIRVFLFIHGLCLSCVQEEDLDADKQYDIFISFCHQDDDFVMDEIVPKLSMYNLCIHYRDWMAGEWIPAQIARSVHDSRRTIIVMSKSFLRSRWGLMEFRMAHATTAEEGCARVIVVLREEVFDVPELDAELKCYLSTNTYVKWGDPWFFEKLRYALPREPIEQREELASEGDEFRMAVNVYRRDDGETTR